MPPLGPRIQRLTGYEVEARIPIYGNQHAGPGFVRESYLEGFTPELGAFLFGGLAYGATYGEEPMGRFTLSADHNELKAAHAKLVDLLTLTGFLDPAVEALSMSSIEYITAARDETQPSGRARMEGDVRAVETHAFETYEKAREPASIPVAFTGDQVLTGVPRKALQVWIEMHGGSWKLFEPAVRGIEVTISDRLYLQQTTGVLPEDFPRLYHTASERLREQKDKWGVVVAQALRLSAHIATGAWDGAFSKVEPPEAFQKGRGAVIGYLTYLASYLMADSLSLTTFVGTGSTEKNLFGFLPRASLHQSFQALPEAVRGQRDAWLALVEPFFKAAEPYGSTYWQKFEWLRPRPHTERTGVFGEGEEDEVSSDSEEVEPRPRPHPDARLKTRAILTTLFKDQDPGEGFQRPLPKLDEPHREIFAATGQKGIAVEDRYFEEKEREPMTLKTFGKAMVSTFGESQGRLLSHVAESRKRIAEEAAAPPDPAKELAARITELRERLDQVPKKVGEEVTKARLKLGEIAGLLVTSQTKVESLDREELTPEEEDDLFDAQNEVKIYTEMIEEQKRTMLELEELGVTATKLATGIDFGVDEKALLAELSGRQQQILAAVWKQGQRVAPPKPETVEVQREGGFYEAKQRLFNRHEIGVARKKKHDIVLEDLEAAPKERVTELLRQADEQYNVFKTIGGFSHKKVTPAETSGPLLAIQQAGEVFIERVNQAYEIYQANRPK